MREVRSTPGGEHPDELQRIRLGNAQRPLRLMTIGFLYRQGLRIRAEEKIDKCYLTFAWEDGQREAEPIAFGGIAGSWAM